MGRAENRHYTLKYKKKRLHFYGARCKRAKCGLCARHKSAGNSLKFHRRKDIVEKEIVAFNHNNMD